MGQFEKFVVWQWKWFDTPRLFLLAPMPALALFAVVFGLRCVQWSMHMEVSVILGCLIVFPLIGVLLIQVHKWYEKRAEADKQEFAIIFGRFSADIDIPTIRAIVQLRVDSTLMQLANIITQVWGDERMEATMAFEHAWRLAKRRDFAVKKTYQEYL